MRSDEEHGANPIDRALKSFGCLTAYQVTLRSKSKGSSETIRYYYKSGKIRMEFIRPFRGAVLVFDPAENRVLMKPFRLSSVVLRLDPDNAMLRSAAGHSPAESDIGSLLKVVAALQVGGTTRILGEESTGGRKVFVVRVAGAGNAAVSGINEYSLWLDRETFLPLKAVAYGLSGECLEEVLMDDLETGIDLPDDLFRLS